MADNPDDTLWVEFYTEAVEHPNKSLEAGRPIFEDREFVKIKFPADNKRVHTAPAHEMHYVSHMKTQMTYAKRFPKHYAVFKEENADFVVGTTLDAAPFLTPAKRAELRAQNVRTVEQLANLPDSALRKLGMGARDMVEQAQAFLKAADSTSEIADLRRQLAALQAQMAAPAASQGAFADLEREDLFNMAVDAGLSPRANASRESLEAMLTEAAQKKMEAA